VLEPLIEELITSVSMLELPIIYQYL